MVLLEGQGSRFPMEWVDFGSDYMPLPDHAGWLLEWNPDDMDEPLLRNVRLLINTRHEEVRRAITASAPYSVDRAIRDSIRFDVARTMITAALERPDFVAHAAEYEDGSVGAAVRRMIRATFGGAGLVELREELHDRPGQFACRLQDAMRLFGSL